MMYNVDIIIPFVMMVIAAALILAKTVKYLLRNSILTKSIIIFRFV